MKGMVLGALSLGDAAFMAYCAEVFGAPETGRDLFAQCAAPEVTTLAPAIVERELDEPTLSLRTLVDEGQEQQERRPKPAPNPKAEPKPRKKKAYATNAEYARAYRAARRADPKSRQEAREAARRSYLARYTPKKRGRLEIAEELPPNAIKHPKLNVWVTPEHHFYTRTHIGRPAPDRKLWYVRLSLQQVDGSTLVQWRQDGRKVRRSVGRLVAEFQGSP